MRLLSNLMTGKSVRVGTRGSKLALTQTEEVVDRFRRLYPQLEFSVEVIKTSGDRASAGGAAPTTQGFFVKELEESLAAGDIDMAVHSLKDMPSEISPEFSIGAILKRERADDVLVSRSGAKLMDLPAGAKLGTGSPRRSVQLLAVRPDLKVRPIVGNVDTRLRKTKEGEVDAVVLAAAAMHRMGWQDQVTEYLPLDVCLPAVAQGALAIEVRAGDSEMSRLVAAFEDVPTRQAVTAERAFLVGLGGGCRAPIAGYGTVQGDRLELKGLFFPSQVSAPIRGQESGPVGKAEEMGRTLAERILAQVPRG